MDKTFHVDNESARSDVLVSCHKILQACKPAKRSGPACTMLKRPVELQSQLGYLVPHKKALTQRNIYLYRLSHLSVYLQLYLYLWQNDPCGYLSVRRSTQNVILQASKYKAELLGQHCQFLYLFWELLLPSFGCHLTHFSLNKFGPGNQFSKFKEWNSAGWSSAWHLFQSGQWPLKGKGMPNPNERQH